MAVGRAILPAAGFQPAGPAGKRVRSQDCAAAVLTFRPHGTGTQANGEIAGKACAGRMHRVDLDYGELVHFGTSNHTRAPESKELSQHHACVEDQNAE